MKHEVQTTETFTRVSYTCDICGNALLDGQRPQVCTICEREICREEECSILAYLDDANYAERLCRECHTVEEGARQQIGDCMDAARQACSDIRVFWKQRSLAHKG